MFEPSDSSTLLTDNELETVAAGGAGLVAAARALTVQPAEVAEAWERGLRREIALERFRRQQFGRALALPRKRAQPTASLRVLLDTARAELAQHAVLVAAAREYAAAVADEERIEAKWKAEDYSELWSEATERLMKAEDKFRRAALAVQPAEREGE